MVYIINKRVGNSVYYYLVKNVRQGPKWKKYKKYLGKELPSKEKLLELEMDIESKAPNKKYHYLTLEQVKALDKIRQKYKHDYKQFDDFLKQKFEKDFITRFTYNSNAIEGNTMDLSETKLVVDDQIAPGGKKLREIFEARNMEHAFKYIQKYKPSINKSFILKIHKIMMEHVMEKDVGMFRTRPIKIVGSNFVPPDAEDVIGEIERFLEFYDFIKKKFHVLEVAALVHMKFSEIHPFIDGNGRVARLLMNYVLIRHSYPPIIIKQKDRERYYKCLEAGHEEKDFKSMVDFLYESMVGEYGG